MPAEDIQKLNTLIVDDDYFVVMDIRDSVVEAGGTAFVASGSEKAITVIDQEDIDFAFVDFHLRQENALSIIRKLKSENIPFAVISGDSRRSIEMHLSEEDYFFRKPLDYGWILKRLAA